jgi:hypothetical protein
MQPNLAVFSLRWLKKTVPNKVRNQVIREDIETGKYKKNRTDMVWTCSWNGRSPIPDQTLAARRKRRWLQDAKSKQTPWPESASELYELSDSHLSAKLVQTFVDGGVSRSQRGGSPTAVISVFLDRSRYFFSQVSPQLYSRNCVYPVPDPLLLRKSGSAGNGTRTSGSVTLISTQQRRSSSGCRCNETNDRARTEWEARGE